MKCQWWRTLGPWLDVHATVTDKYGTGVTIYDCWVSVRLLQVAVGCCRLRWG